MRIRTKTRHTWSRSRFAGTVHCSNCGLVPVGAEDFDPEDPCPGSWPEDRYPITDRLRQRHTQEVTQ